jgi:hypothetical protein
MLKKLPVGPKATDDCCQLPARVETLGNNNVRNNANDSAGNVVATPSR